MNSNNYTCIAVSIEETSSTGEKNDGQTVHESQDGKMEVRILFQCVYHNIYTYIKRTLFGKLFHFDIKLGVKEELKDSKNNYSLYD